jgi:hypothetical protein
MGVVEKTLKIAIFEVREKGKNPLSTLVQRPTKCLPPQWSSPLVYTATQLCRQRTSTQSMKGQGAFPFCWKVRWAGVGAWKLQLPWNMTWFCAHRTFSPFGLLGNKGMHCYNGNEGLHHLEQWHELIEAIYEEGEVPRGYVMDFGEYVWKDLHSYHRNKHPNSPLDMPSAKAYTREIVGTICCHGRMTAERPRRQLLIDNMALMTEKLFDLQREDPDWFAPIEDKAEEPLVYKVRFTDVPLAIKAILPSKKGRQRSFACSKTRQEIERNLKIANDNPLLTFTWWKRSMAHPSPPCNRIGCGKHKMPERAIGTLTTQPSGQDSAGMVEPLRAQPQESGKATTTPRSQADTCKGQPEGGLSQPVWKGLPQKSRVLLERELDLLESKVSGMDITALSCLNTLTGCYYKWTLSTYPHSSRDGTSEPVGETVALPNRQSLTEEGVV